MHLLEHAALVVVGVAIVTHLATTFMAIRRCRALPPEQDTPPDVSQPACAPAVSIVRPVRGLDQYDDLTLGSSFSLDWPDYELIFCCADASDEAVPAVRDLIAAYPQIEARLLIGDDRPTPNPKLNNLIKGWHAAKHDWIVFADSNVLMPPDYLTRLLATWRPDTGLVCSPPIGYRPEGFWAELECAFLNTYQARWQYSADSVGLGFAQGKTMLWRRAELEAAGGIEALGKETAEDAAATKVVRSQGLRVRLVDRPFVQPLGLRSATDVWNRQLRWAKLRRASFPALFACELLTGLFIPLLFVILAAGAVGLDKAALVLGLAFVWYGAEALLAVSAGWHVTWRSPFAWVARDVALPVLWLAAWFGNDFTWRENPMNVDRVDEERTNRPTPRQSV